MNGLGFVTMAFGPDRYLRQAETLALSLRRHMPGIPLAIITDRADAGPLFDTVLKMKPVAQAGTVHKVDIYDYSPYSETLFIDSDCIVTRPFTEELNEIREYDFTPVVNRYLVRGESDLWLDNVAAALDGVNGESFPKFNGGVYFFKKVNLARQIFSRANELRSHTKRLGIKDFDKAGPGEETLIGLTLAEMSVTHLYDDHGRMMRTPLNMIGNLRIDALGGGCTFNKEGSMVSPAICHFCGDWVRSPEYLISEYMVRNGRRPRPLFRAMVNGHYYLNKYGQKIKRKILRLGSSLVPSLAGP
jgi:hypothetical protein